MDIRTLTHELTRALAVLRTRRRIFVQKPDWALSRDGFGSDRSGRRYACGGTKKPGRGGGQPH
ncbi:hypothetical protein [Mesorhizobium sp.]|nr:hypothetical protein [Mesorhizobium sp.]